MSLFLQDVSYNGFKRKTKDITSDKEIHSAQTLNDQYFVESQLEVALKISQFLILGK